MIKQRSDELSRSREATHLKEIWEFCNKCDSCFESDEAASCSVAGCQMYRTCHCDLDDTIEDYFYDNFRDKNCSKIEEQRGRNGWYRGGDSCWICRTEFCKYHFCEHYQACRATVSFCCGFHPPTAYSYAGFVCLPGHCGRDRRHEHASEYHICHKTDYYGENSCGTLVCEDCAEHCNRDGCQYPRHCGYYHSGDCFVESESSTDEGDR